MKSFITAGTLALFIAFGYAAQNAQAINNPLPDLVVERVTFNQNRQATAIIANRGEAPAPITTPRGYILMRWWYPNNTPAGAGYQVRDLLPLEAGATMAAFWPSSAPVPSGENLELRAQIVIPPVWSTEDNAFRPALEESNTENNSTGVRPYTDLRLDEVRLERGRVPVVTVDNLGTMVYQTSPAPYLAYRWLGPNNNELLRQEIQNLNTVWQGGQSRTFDYPAPASAIPPNADLLQIRLYRGGTSGSEFIDIQNLNLPGFDIRVHSVSFNDTSRRPTVTVRNNGSGPYLERPDWQVMRMEFRWYDGGRSLRSGDRIEQILPYDIPPGETRDVLYMYQDDPSEANRRPIPYRANRLHILIRGGPEHQLIEYYEVNVPQPNLDIDTSALDTDSRRPSVTIRNNGAGGAPQPSPIGRISWEWLNEDYELLYLGQSINQIFPFSLAPGTSGSVGYPLDAPSGPADARHLRIHFSESEAGPIFEYFFNLIDPEDTAEDIVEQEEHTVVFLIGSTLQEDETPEAHPVGEIDTSEYTVREFEGREEESGVSREELAVGERPAPTGRAAAPAPRILPGNPLYAFRTLGRELRALFTFDPQKDARLRLRYANEKILEANALADRGQTERAARHLRSYNRELTKQRVALSALQKRDADSAQALNIQAIKTELLHQVIVSKVERKAPEGAQAEIQETKSAIAQNLAENIARVDEPERAAQIVSEALDKSGSPFRHLRNLGVLKALEEKVPDEAKAAIVKAQENAAEQFARQIQVLPESQRVLIGEYAGKVGGDKTETIKTLDQIITPETPPAVKETLDAVKEKILEQIETPEAPPPTPAMPKAPLEPKFEEKSETPKTSVPLICTQEYNPVCGADGQTYSNRCVAEKQKFVKIAYEGECKKEVEQKPAQEFIKEPLPAKEPAESTTKLTPAPETITPVKEDISTQKTIQ